MDPIDVLSYHCAAPSESSYSAKSTANLTMTRQRLIDSIIRQKNNPDYLPTTTKAVGKQDDRRFNSASKSNTRFLVPNLYANQRVCQRSTSKSSSPIRLHRDLKKTVAFGRTTTIERTGSVSSMRLSTSTSSIYSKYKLHSMGHHLHARDEASDKLRNDVDQLQKIVKNLIKDNAEMQERVFKSQLLQTNIDQLNKLVQELTDNNAALQTRINMLELWQARSNSNSGYKCSPGTLSRQQHVHNSNATTATSTLSACSQSLAEVSENECTHKSRSSTTNAGYKKYDYRAIRRMSQTYVGDQDSSLQSS